MPIQDLFSLTGQTVLVTGAGSGLGRAIALACGEAGGNVVCADMDLATAEETAALIGTGGSRSLAVTVDVTDEPAVERMVKAATDAYGSIDVVFCNAGISGTYRRIDQVDIDEWRRVIDVDLTGVMLTAKHAARVMIPQGHGKMILTASIWGLIGSDSVPIPEYAAAKGGVVNLTRELALELAESGITVNALAPGFFNTNIGRNTPPEVKVKLREASIALLPTHRRSVPDEIQGPALFLAGSASNTVNGHILVVDGGALAR